MNSDALKIAHQCLQRRPFRLEILLVGQLLAFGDLLTIRVERGLFSGVQAEHGNTALTID